MGKANAASAAASMRLSYRQLRLALVVGVCGGMPNSRDGDIFIGDVVISKTLIQYDLGRHYPDKFVRKDTADTILGRPTKDVRNLLAKLETDRHLEQLERWTAQCLQQLQANVARTKHLGKYDYPSMAEDKLFKPSYRHKHQVKPTCICADCSGDSDPVCSQALSLSCEELGCDDQHNVARTRSHANWQSGRDGDGQDVARQPQVHIGAVASGDTVAKSAADRDRLSNETGVISFEMEGAGVWDEVPCIVVKGVCDYADSHKHKRWQNFAAATAALASKAILQHYIRTDKPVKAFAGDNGHVLAPRFANMAESKEDQDSCNVSSSYGDSNTFKFREASATRYSSVLQQPCSTMSFLHDANLINRSDGLKRSPVGSEELTSVASSMRIAPGIETRRLIQQDPNILAAGIHNLELSHRNLGQWELKQGSTGQGTGGIRGTDTRLSVAIARQLLYEEILHGILNTLTHQTIKSAALVKTDQFFPDYQLLNNIGSILPITDQALPLSDEGLQSLIFLRNRRNLKPPAFEDPFWLGPAFQRWKEEDSSSLIIIRSKFRDRLSVKDFCINATEVIREASIPVLWELRPLAAEEDMQGIHVVNILKSLISQALRITTNCRTESFIASVSAQIGRATSVNDWLDSLGAVLTGIREIVMIVDMGLSQSAMDSSIPTAFFTLFRKLDGHNANTRVKVILISYELLSLCAPAPKGLEDVMIAVGSVRRRMPPAKVSRRSSKRADMRNGKDLKTSLRQVMIKRRR